MVRTRLRARLRARAAILALGISTTGAALLLRLSGSEAAVGQAALTLSREVPGAAQLGTAEAMTFWRELREQLGPWFAGGDALWRVSVPSTAEPLALGDQCIEWSGALRWLRTALPASIIRERARALGGHATLFRGGDQRLKDEFDPARIFNTGRMYPGL